MTTTLVSNRLDAPSYTDAEFAHIVDELTRRGFLAGGLSAAAVIGLSACGANGNVSDGPTGSTAPWTSIDDLGKQVSLPRTPTRIAALADNVSIGLWAAGVHVVASPMVEGTDEQLRRLGATEEQITSIVAYSPSNEPNIEKLTGARPDLLVGNGSDGKIPFVQDNPRLKDVAPVLGVNLQTATFEHSMDSLHSLVKSLGVAPTDTQARQQYQQVADALRTAARNKSGLRVMVCYPDDTGLTIMSIKWVETATLAGLGFTLVPAEGGANEFGKQVSWEDVTSLPADVVVLVDFPGKGAPTNPLWARMPAVAAGQYVVLNGSATFEFTYANYTTLLSQIAAVIDKARPGVGPR